MSVTEARPAVPDAARRLILAAAHGDAAEFGAAYSAAVSGTELDLITHATLGILNHQVVGWLPEGADVVTSLDIIHRRLLRLYPRCTALVGVNLVVLEHVARASVGLSDLLTTLPGTQACLYGALIVAAGLDGPVELDELAERLDA